MIVHMLEFVLAVEDEVTAVPDPLPVYHRSTTFGSLDNAMHFCGSCARKGSTKAAPSLQLGWTVEKAGLLNDADSGRGKSSEAPVEKKVPGQIDEETSAFELMPLPSANAFGSWALLSRKKTEIRRSL
jgi:hypothetical protein